MNETLTQIVFFVIGGLLGVVNWLLRAAAKEHVDSDLAYQKRTDAELATKANEKDVQRIEARLEEIAKRVHAFGGQIGKVDQWQRFHDDRRHDERREDKDR